MKAGVRMNREEGFLGRWSRLKQQVREQDESVGEDKAVLSQDEGPTPPRLDDPLPPALEELDASSDFSAFLSDRVDEGLRKAALRKLFHLPQFNVLDGLDDYAEDYTSFAPLGDLVTEEMKHMAEVERQRIERRLHEMTREQVLATDASVSVTGADQAYQSQTAETTSAEQNHLADDESPA